MTTSTQRDLPLRVPRVKTPMVDLAGAFSILGDATETEICELVDCGYLWAWNIGDSTARRRELRILSASLAHLQTVNWRECLHGCAPARRAPESWEQTLAILLPRHQKPWFTSKECKRVLNCRRQHFLDLIVAGDLRSTTYRRGPGGSPNVDRQEFTRFLEARVIGGL